jgi:hypothetical protein
MICLNWERLKAKTMTGAYSFICNYSSTDALCARLNQVAWHWQVGDSYWHGDYVAARPFPGVRIRIVDFPTRTETGYRYDSDVRLTKECTTPMEEIDAAYRNILAQIPAHDIKEIETFD